MFGSDLEDVSSSITINRHAQTSNSCAIERSIPPSCYPSHFLITSRRIWSPLSLRTKPATQTSTPCQHKTESTYLVSPPIQQDIACRYGACLPTHRGPSLPLVPLASLAYRGLRLPPWILPHESRVALMVLSSPTPLPYSSATTQLMMRISLLNTMITSVASSSMPIFSNQKSPFFLLLPVTTNLDKRITWLLSGPGNEHYHRIGPWWHDIRDGKKKRIALLKCWVYVQCWNAWILCSILLMGYNPRSVVSVTWFKRQTL